MKRVDTSRLLSLINIAIVLYFTFMYLINRLNIDSVLIGFFTNLLTIPFLLAEICFLFLGIKFIIKNKRKDRFLYLSLTLLTISFILTYGSFLIK